MKGYWRDEAQTKKAIHDGWIYTGDLGVLDEEGYCKVIGRIKDTIIRGGENIFPSEVEEFLYTFPKIEDVQVVGVADTKYGEQICACVKLRAGQQSTDEEIQNFCKDKIAHYKIPKYVLFFDSFAPYMTITGKIQKFKLREECSKRLKISDEKFQFNSPRK